MLVANCHGAGQTGRWRTVPRSPLKACFEFRGGTGVQTGGDVWTVWISVGDGLRSGVGGSGPITGARGFSPRRGRSRRAFA